ncbi:MAG: hypothetical protein Q9162_001115 [Coniocarpon cinnabarinum]
MSPAASPSSSPSTRTCTLWIHDDATSHHPVIFNPDLLSVEANTTDRVLKVLPVVDDSGSPDAADNDAVPSDVRDYAIGRPDARPTQSKASIDPDAQPLVFVARKGTETESTRFRNVQISVSKRVAAVHGFYSRMSVLVADASWDEHAASHVELTFSDPLNRADLWKTTISELSRRQCVYQGQELFFLGNIKITIKKLFIDGRRAPSGFFTKDSRAIFRSTSARFILGIQVSREMYESDDELSGGTFWAKAADFVSTLLERWRLKGTRHMLSIVLFSRLSYSQNAGDDDERDPVDLYRVVASDLPDFKNAKILHILHRSFRSFTHEIMTRRVQCEANGDAQLDLSTARRGNFLEAINTAISACWLDELDLDFERTGTSIVMVSPGCGSFDIDENLLRITSQRLAGRSIGVELVCLAAIPLHVVPLFVLSTSCHASDKTRKPKVLPQQTSGLLPNVNGTRGQDESNNDNTKERNKTSLSPTESVFVMPSWIETSFYQDLRTTGIGSHSEAHRLVQRMNQNHRALASRLPLKSRRATELQSRLDVSHGRNDWAELERAMDEHDENVFTRAPVRGSAVNNWDRFSFGNTISSGSWSRIDSSKASPTEEGKVHKRTSTTSVRNISSASDKAVRMDHRNILGALLGRSGAGKASATTESSTENARSSLQPHDRQQNNIDPRTVSGRLQQSLSRSSSNAIVPTMQKSEDTRASQLDTAANNDATSISGGTPFRSVTPRSSFEDQPESGRRDVVVSKRELRDHRNAVAPRGTLPWLRIRNPCRMEMEVTDAFGEWNHAFTSERKAHAVKWKALCSPASLPLTTEYYPSKTELESAFAEGSYTVPIKSLSVEHQRPQARRAHLARELVLYRIAEGFQIAVGLRAQRVIGPHGANVADFYDDSFMSEDGAAVMMLKGDDVHVVIAAGTSAMVRHYKREDEETTPLLHNALIRTYMDSDYSLRPLNFRVRPDLEWRKLDAELAEAEAYSCERQVAMPITSSHTRKARFVLIPVDNTNTTRTADLGSQENDEELRLDGIRKLTVLWQRHRWISPEDENHHASWIGHKDVNPLAIEYQTRDPSAIVSAGFESSILTEGESTAAMTHLFDEEEQYRTSHVDLQRLATELQGGRGINVRARRWHFRVYEYCFVGHDLVGFLLSRFQDISNRDEAVEFGNVLMRKALFRHVNNKHKFRDGNFFFTIENQYRVPKNDLQSTWSTVRKVLSSVPVTPFTEAPKDPFDQTSVDETSELSKRPRVVLSGAISHNIDPKHVSTRPEIITIHYDRLHHPENCFHFMLEWTNATAKLVEDSLHTWAAIAAKHALRLVQLPIAEVTKTPQINPLRTPYAIEMILKAAPTLPILATDSPMLKAGRASSAKHIQKQLLKKFGFVLDFEASSSFPADVEVVYSYGQGDFDHDQYVHKSGLLLVEIVDDWKFVVLANRLCDSRPPPRPPERSSLGDALQRANNASLPARSSAAALSSMSDASRSPLVSPRSVRPFRDDGASNDAVKGQWRGPFGRPGEDILREFEAFCHNADALRDFYEEVSRSTPERSTPALSALSASQTPSLKASIPILDLPDALDKASSKI